MRRARSKKLAIMILFTFMATLFAAVPMASAAGNYTALSKTTIKDNVKQADLGTVFAEFPAGAIESGDVVTVEMSSGIEFPANSKEDNKKVPSVENSLPEESSVPYIYVPKQIDDKDNALRNAKLDVDEIRAREFKLKVSGAVYAENKASIYFYFKNMKVDNPSSGDVTVKFSSPDGSGFGSDQVVIGKVTSKSALTVSVDSKAKVTDTAKVELRINEDVAASLKKGKVLKLRLPNGFEWRDRTADPLTKAVSIWGKLTADNVDVKSEKRDLKIFIKDDQNESNEASCIKVAADITVVDESKAKLGDIEVTISGDSGYGPSSLVVGKYMEFGAGAEAGDVPQIIAGQLEQEIGDIVINEDGPGSLIKERTITLELPGNCKWTKAPEIDAEEVDAEIVGFVGSNARTLKYKINQESKTNDDPGKITFEKGEIATAADFAGDVKVVIGGTAGVKDEVLVAEVVPAVDATADAPDVKIGLQSQVAGDITITEAEAEVLNQDKDLTVTLPNGVRFTETPTVEVTEGDLELDDANIKLDEDDTVLVIPIDSESSKASTVEITNIKYTVDRTYPEGKIEAKIGGLALIEVNDTEDDGAIRDYWTSYDKATTEGRQVDIEGAGENGSYTIDEDGMFKSVTTAVKVINASCVTPAQKDILATAVFTIGETAFTVNGVEMTMDVAPYIKNDRTFLPVRFVSNAVGVDNKNIVWNDAAKTVTILKGERMLYR
ncbi:MAG: copper amine oxidase N-terminal domain-containing protein [Syntrophothermaceae bacterium]